jgi:type III pantothenate kinase
MLLTADIGNTNVTLGAFKGSKLIREWRLATDPRKTADEYGLQLKGLVDGEISSVALGSVVPALTPVFKELSQTYFGVEPLVVTAKTRLGLKYLVDNPTEVGADRVLNALAAWKLYGAPAIVVDFGTATTFDCLSKKAEYLGGAILIGPNLASRALAAGTAQLQQVEIRRTERVIGRNTIECLQAGLYHGYLGMIERVLRESVKEMGGKPVLLATGGLAGLYAADLKLKVVPELTLQGLRLAHELSAG